MLTPQGAAKINPCLHTPIVDLSQVIERFGTMPSAFKDPGMFIPSASTHLLTTWPSIHPAHVQHAYMHICPARHKTAPLRHPITAPAPAYR